MRRLIVIFLERACNWLRHTWYLPGTGHCHLANLSDHLDQRWGTGVWD